MSTVCQQRSVSRRRRKWYLFGVYEQRCHRTAGVLQRLHVCLQRVHLLSWLQPVARTCAGETKGQRSNRAHVESYEADGANRPCTFAQQAVYLSGLPVWTCLSFRDVEHLVDDSLQVPPSQVTAHGSPLSLHSVCHAHTCAHMLTHAHICTHMRTHAHTCAQMHLQ